jgi:hypothetical protein
LLLFSCPEQLSTLPTEGNGRNAWHIGVCCCFRAQKSKIQLPQRLGTCHTGGSGDDTTAIGQISDTEYRRQHGLYVYHYSAHADSYERNFQMASGNLEIDLAVAVLEQIDNLSNDLYQQRLSPQSYREKICQLILGLSDTGTKMFSAVFVNEDQLEEQAMQS